MEITEMMIEHYDAGLRLMQHTSGIAVRSADSKEATPRHLKRNPELSFVALESKEVIGCAMCSYDGRRG